VVREKERRNERRKERINNTQTGKEYVLKGISAPRLVAPRSVPLLMVLSSVP
jgi:hypothetical protein